MREMKCFQFASVFCLVVAAFGTTASAGQTSTALRCGVDQNQQAKRFFADPDGKNWKEYQSVDVPQLDLQEGALSRLWTGSDGNVLIRTEESGEDFAAYTDYCFDQSGQLIQVRFELRTAWGWGYRKEGPIQKGLLAPKISEFFSTETEKHITKPEQAENIPDALKPRLYLRKSKLPFFNLLSK
jgi:hypothetical protein